jgi:flagellar hook-associated protein 1 FlgK
MASGDPLGIAISGLLAFQRGLATTGHNIANVNTEGYSRQRVELAARLPTASGDGYIGNGVNVATVRRAYDAFLTTQVRTSTAAHSQLDSFYALASQVDGLLADPQAGLAPPLQSFFQAVQGVANDPTSIPARQTLLGAAATLADRFHYLDSRLDDLQASVNTQIRTGIAEINDLAGAIATLNERIVQATGASGGQPPNDLLDQRDQLIARLSEWVSVSTVAQSDGALNVYIGNGQTLVLGNRAQALVAVGNEYDASRTEVGYLSGASTVNITSQLSGGKLAGALEFRRQLLDPARNALGRIALALSADFNDQHALGQDLNGSLGGDFFSALGGTSPEALASANNGSGATLAVTVSDPDVLTTSDYRLHYDGATYTVTRLSDNATVYSGATAPTTLASEGLTLALSGTAVAGDSFLIRPTRRAAEDFAVAVSDPRAIAAAAPIRTAAALANSGNARISAGTVNAPPPPDVNLQQTVTITFTSPSTYDVSGTGTGNPSGLAYVSGANISYNGWTVQISGTPAAGDVFTVQANTDGAGDNRNALLLGGLQNSPRLAGGSTTYSDAYAQLVAEVGSKTQSADMNRQAQAAVLAQAVNAREAVSGVNLDEEAASLLRYQQAYQAAAQTISVADNMFQTLLAVLRR